MSYIRPALKVPAHAPLRFKTVVNSNGSHVSSWVAEDEPHRVTTGTYGRVGDICAKIDLGTGSVREEFKRPWSPPLDYESYARKKNLGPDFLKKCADWHVEHPREVFEAVAQPVIDSEPVVKMFRKYSKKGKPFDDCAAPQPTRPPLDRMAVAWECAGYSQTDIDLAVARLQFAESQLDVRQQALDAVFARYPSASKPVSKKSKKVIKAVKKKMT